MWSSSVITLALLLLFGGSASAESCIFSSAPGFQLKSDTVEWAMKIASGHTCIRGSRSGAVSSSTVELISPPQSGQVTVLGPGFSYKAKADFQGPDAFTLRVSGTLMRTRGTSEIRVIVDVGGK
jgi:hypothetical protein